MQGVQSYLSLFAWCSPEGNLAVLPCYSSALTSLGTWAADDVSNLYLHVNIGRQALLAASLRLRLQKGCSASLRSICSAAPRDVATLR